MKIHARVLGEMMRGLNPFRLGNGGQPSLAYDSIRVTRDPMDASKLTFTFMLEDKDMFSETLWSWYGDTMLFTGFTGSVPVKLEVV